MTQTQSLVDTRFGEYELMSRLGGGGFGEVWLARKPGERPVALKILGGHQQSEEATRLRAEIELLAAAASSRSSHIVRVLGGGSEPAPHVVMEYIEGTDLSQEIARRAAIPVKEIVGIAAGIAKALATLQESGIIHRDIKPANVMIDGDGKIKLTDFGIAKIVGLDSVTTTNHLTMSMAYAAPEVWDGQCSYLSDHYAFGALLFHCLTGRPLFTGTHAEMYRHHVQTVPNLDALPKEVPQALRKLISDCLAKVPEQRPATAKALLAAIGLADEQLETDVEATVIRSRPEPKSIGPWVIDSRDAPNNWLFHCHHESTSEKALVAVHFANSLEDGDALRKQATADMDRKGAGCILGTNRLVLRPGEGWRGAPPSPFLFWVARDASDASTRSHSSTFIPAAIATTSSRRLNRASETQTPMEELSLRFQRLESAQPVASQASDAQPKSAAVRTSRAPMINRRPLMVAVAGIAAVGAVAFLTLGTGSAAGGRGSTTTKELSASVASPIAGPSAADYFTSGKAAFDTKDYKKAVADLTKAIELNPKEAAPFRFRGYSYQLLKQNDFALADFNRAVELAPTDGLQYRARGIFYKDALNNPTAAWYDLNKAIELNPNDDLAYFNRGVINANANNAPAALADYTKAIDLDTKVPESYNNRGVIYLNQGKNDLAVVDFTKAIEISPNDAQDYQNRGVAYKGLGKYEEAKADFTKVIAIDSSSESTTYGYYNRANVFVLQKNDSAAIADYSKAIELSPSYADAYGSRATIYMGQHKDDLAVADLTTAIRLDPSRAIFYGNRGIEFTMLNRFEEARADFTREIELGDAAEGYFRRGLAFADENKLPQAVSDLSKAIELNPNDGRAYKMRGTIYQSQGKTDLARADLAKAQSLGK